MKNRLWMAMITLVLTGCGSEAEEPIILEGNELVYKENVAIQCQEGRISTEQTAKMLTDKGIDVVSSHCGEHTGVAVLAVCGAGTLHINLHQIANSSVADAVELGFGPVSELKNEEGRGYIFEECPSAK